MLTAEMRDLPQHSSFSSPSRAPAPVPTLFASRWTRFGVWCLAVLSLGASLVYMGNEERPPAAAYALDQDWAATSPFGVNRAAGAPPLMTAPVLSCATCGRVEAVVALRPTDPPAGRKPVFQVKVRMEDGHTQTVRVGKPLAVGTAVTLEHGVLRVASA